jgi:hypothetical protein
MRYNTKHPCRPTFPWRIKINGEYWGLYRTRREMRSALNWIKDTKFTNMHNVTEERIEIGYKE